MNFPRQIRKFIHSKLYHPSEHRDINQYTEEEEKKLSAAKDINSTFRVPRDEP